MICFRSGALEFVDADALEEWKVKSINHYSNPGQPSSFKLRLWPGRSNLVPFYLALTYIHPSTCSQRRVFISADLKRTNLSFTYKRNVRVHQSDTSSHDEDLVEPDFDVHLSMVHGARWQLALIFPHTVIALDR